MIADALEKIDAILSGHALIAKDHLHQIASEHRFRLGRAGGTNDFEFDAQDAPQGFERSLLVIDDEHDRGRGRQTVLPRFLAHQIHAASVKSPRPRVARSTNSRQLLAGKPVDDTPAAKGRRHLHEAMIVLDQFDEALGKGHLMHEPAP